MSIFLLLPNFSLIHCLFSMLFFLLVFLFIFFQLCTFSLPIFPFPLSESLFILFIPCFFSIIFVSYFQIVIRIHHTYLSSVLRPTDVNNFLLNKISQKRLHKICIFVFCTIINIIGNVLQTSLAVLENRKPVLRDLVKHGKALAEQTGDPQPLETVAAVTQRFNETEDKSHEKEAFLDKVSVLI